MFLIDNLNMGNWYSWLLCSLLLVGGFIFLVKGSDIFVASSSSVAKKFHISPMIIGLTVVAFGTSLPELAVSTSDAISCLANGGNANVGIGNVVGSHICNLLIVLGFSVIFAPIVVKRSVCKKEFPFLIFITILLSLFVVLFGGKSKYTILRIESGVLLLLFVLYMIYIILDAKKQIKEGMVDENSGQDTIKEMSNLKAFTFIILGAAAIALGGEAVVYGAKNIAYGIGDKAGLNKDLVESLVGLTIVAVGTSLPELVTSIIAAKKKENDIALGNVIGSNIFNILFVLSVSGLVCPLTVGNQIIVDLIVMFLSTIVVFIMSLRKNIKRRDGIILVSLYFIYLIYLIARTLV